MGGVCGPFYLHFSISPYSLLNFLLFLEEKAPILVSRTKKKNCKRQNQNVKDTWVPKVTIITHQMPQLLASLTSPTPIKPLSPIKTSPHVPNFTTSGKYPQKTRPQFLHSLQTCHKLKPQKNPYPKQSPTKPTTNPTGKLQL